MKRVLDQETLERLVKDNVLERVKPLNHVYRVRGTRVVYLRWVDDQLFHRYELVSDKKESYEGGQKKKK